MDNAVALVQTYLHVNGYFTVAEYPIIGSGRHGGYRTVTDLDILAFRFPGATRLVPRLNGRGDAVAEKEEPDPVLGVPVDQADMLIGEVKEGRARINDAATDPAVLEAALARFGCSPSMNTRQLAETLIKKGRTILPSRHHLRMVAFGRVDEEEGHAVYLTIPMGHVVEFLQKYLRRHWEVLRHAEFKDPAFGFLATLEKALRGAT
jgi:hypothetical protein